jgi:hypothetical protein
MLRIALSRRALLVYAALILAGRAAPADDKPKLSGSWEKKEGEMKLEFDGDELTLYPHGDTVDFQLECSYAVEKDGLVRAKITRLGGRKEIVEKAKGVLPVGTEFKFKWKTEGDAATLDALEGKEIEHAKDRLEGAYVKKP